MPYLSNGKEKIQVPPETSLVDVAETIGVPFSCTKGNCGTCLVEVLEGMEYLQPIDQQEDIFGLQSNERLLCQARFKSGVGDNDITVIKP